RFDAVIDICLPSVEIQSGIAAAAPELEIMSRSVLWSDGTPPLELTGVQFWVPAFPLMLPDGLAAAVTAMPNLLVVQTQSEGVEALIGRLPESVPLCTARGAHTTATAEWTLAAMLAVLRSFPRFERARW